MLCKNCVKKIREYELNCKNCGFKIEFPNIPSYKAGSVISIFIALPLGVAAFIFSNKTEEQLKKGNFQEAIKQSKLARAFILASMVGLFLYIALALLNINLR